MRSSIVRVIASSLLLQAFGRQSPLLCGSHSLTAEFAPLRSGRSFALFASRRFLPGRPAHFSLFSSAFSALPQRSLRLRVIFFLFLFSPLVTRHFLQFLHFLLRQRPKFPRRHIQYQRPQLHPLDLLHQKPHALKHAPNLSVPPFDQNHFVPRIRPVLRQPNLRRRRFHSLAILQFNRNSSPQSLNRFLIRLPADFHQICLRHVRARFHQLLRQRAIV